MNLRSKRAGVGLVVAGLIAALFFAVTDPQFPVLLGGKSPADLVDQINQNRPGTLVGLVGCAVVIGVGVWLMLKRTAER